MQDKLVRTSKFLSLVLRHQPEKIGIALDAQGWVEISTLLSACSKNGMRLSHDELRCVVENNNKKRFAISDDGLRIRASQGHSTDVDLGYQAVAPLEVLYHGTATRWLESIRASGLNKGRRHHVHLSADAATAIAVGQRHGKPVVLRVRAGDMARAGFEFFLSANGVWLTDAVPAEYLEEMP